jgi:thiamine biosynthesis lipoprotein
MGTVVSIHVVRHDSTAASAQECRAAIGRAIEWFHRVERDCSRFDPDSEIMRLSRRVGESVPVTDLVYEVVQFAVAVAEESDGAFDPTVGLTQEARGFNREYRSGAVVRTALEAADGTSYRDIRLDPATRTVTLAAPLVLDLGAVAKGLAVDLAVRELEPLEHFTVDAGGDLYLAGSNADGDPWSVGIRHPREPGALIETLHLSNAAVCTSGDYEQQGGAGAGGHHIVDPHTGVSPTTLASVTVVAPSAMVADALGTAAFVLGPTAGAALLDRHGVEWLMFTPSLERLASGAAR